MALFIDLSCDLSDSPASDGCVPPIGPSIDAAPVPLPAAAASLLPECSGGHGDCALQEPRQPADAAPSRKRPIDAAPPAAARQEDDLLDFNWFSPLRSLRSRPAYSATSPPVDLLHASTGWANGDHTAVFFMFDLDPPEVLHHERLRAFDATGAIKKEYRNTERVGQYLMHRGFPLIGEGTATLVFLLKVDLVAKVARHRPGEHNGPREAKLSSQHFAERALDLSMSKAPSPQLLCPHRPDRWSWTTATALRMAPT